VTGRRSRLEGPALFAAAAAAHAVGLTEEAFEEWVREVESEPPPDVETASDAWWFVERMRPTP
jgi:hypothetical protein